MKRKFYTIIPLAAVSVLALTSCNLEVNPPIESGTSLITAINYNANQRIIYSKDASYKTPDGKHVYNKGDYKPFWEYVQNKLHITLKEHAAAANSGEKKSVAYFRDNWLNKPYADISMGTVNAITKYAVSGNKETILDLRPYMFDKDFKIIDGTKLPNLAKFLKKNFGVMTSIMTAKHSKADQAALYFVPYMDGFDDNERSIMVRQDYITKLLDNNLPYYSEDNNIIGPQGSNAKYKLSIEEPYIKDKTYDIKLPNVNIDTGAILPGGYNVKYTKRELDATHLSIIEQQNELIKKGEATSKKLVKQFKDYINWRYIDNTQPGYTEIFKKPSDLFLGWKACYDTDELIALMRLVKVSSKTLYGKDDNMEMVTWFPSEWTNMRSADLYRWAGQVFGVRGTDSRTGYLYFNGLNTFKEPYKSTDKIHDCRGDKEMWNLLKTLQKLYKEGLLMQDFDSQTATGTNNRLFNEQLLLEYKEEKDKPNKKYHGFMEYYVASSESKFNEYNEEYQKTSDKKTEDGTIFGPMIGAVTKWDTDNDTKQGETDARDTYMQFTESWISAKTSGLCLNADLANNEAKREAAFSLIDYIFSPKGKADYNYGPMEYGYYYPGDTSDGGDGFDHETGEIKPKTGTYPEGKKGYVEYKGKKYPEYTPEAEEELKKVSGVARERIGICLPFGYERMNGAVYQQTRVGSRDGVDKINVAIQCGTFKHTCINDVMTEYATLDTDLINELNTNPDKKPFYKIIPASFCLTDGQNTDVARILDKTKLGSMYTDDNQSQFNIWDDYVMGQKSTSAPDFDKYLETVNGSWECPKLVRYYQEAYEMMA